MSLVDRTIGTDAWASLRHRLPDRVGFAVEAGAIAADLPSLRRLMGLRRSRPGGRQELVTVRARTLRGAGVGLRPGSTDVWAFLGLLPPYNRAHVPTPDVVPRDARCVWDLGANIGLTMAHLAVALPDARVVGIELDPGNAERARANTAHWAERCEVVVGAVWSRPGDLVYAAPEGQEVGFHATAAGDDQAPGDGALLHARAITLGELARTHAGPDGRIAFVKMDIEGAERDVLRDAAEWAPLVDAISVEVHPPYELDDCLEDVLALGFVIRDVLPGEGDSRPAVIASR